MLEEFPEIPKSSQITSFTFEEKLSQYFEEGYTDVKASVGRESQSLFAEVLET